MYPMLAALPDKFSSSRKQSNKGKEEKQNQDYEVPDEKNEGMFQRKQQWKDPPKHKYATMPKSFKN